MRLSMQMLCDRLKQYDPEPDIRKNGRHLQSVRLFSENLRYTPSTLDLTPMEWGRIVCSNENDILVLHTDDINEVYANCNRIMVMRKGRIMQEMANTEINADLLGQMLGSEEAGS